MKKLLYLILILSLIISGTAFVAATDENDEEITVVPFVGMEFVGEEIRLSLDDAIERMMRQGAPIEQANLMLLSDRARTRSHFDQAEALTSLRNIPASALIAGRPSRTREQMAHHAAEFAQEQANRNFDAAVNRIKRDAMVQYFSLAHAQENVRISLDNVAAQETLYRNTQSRFEVGVASRMEVLMAELALNQAIVDAERNEIAYYNARMMFNIAFGFDLMQNIVITDALEEAPISEISLEDAVRKALENRNEIHGAVFDVQHFEYLRRETGNNVSRSSGTYRTVVAGQRAAEAAYEHIPKQIEAEVRSKYLDMQQRKSELELGRMNVENAREAFRLANLQYEVGMITLAETHSALLMVYNAELFLNMTLLQHNLAIMDFELATTVGINRVPL
jgi:outer membrane protein TolC